MQREISDDIKIGASQIVPFQSIRKTLATDESVSLTMLT